ncbi:hypothetical protein BS47DRAFT_1304506 [Hydnum rufescens UP504]|uniref:AAA+ ATPase domain-containing protein n=1 Tax=Hydnum rufescens UP504 TaxID=1448309 RepID=A0A9P6AKL3_9AGAM|nr:hypothetical protein BS47DRAFT_1304506 [Hydnum rufescens UP504]
MCGRPGYVSCTLHANSPDSAAHLAGLTTKFEDVCISQTIINAIHSIVTFPLLYPSAYRGGILKSESMSGILLYGPPGTGKTLLCKAVAKQCNTHMLQITSASVQNKWVGETEKYIKAIFSLARRLGPCIVFIDEVDALFRNRNGSYGSSYQSSMVICSPQEMDGLQSSGTNKENGIIVIGCTNRPYDLDDAVLRRLPRRLLVDLPRFEEREIEHSRTSGIITALLRDEELDGVDISEIARRTKLFSGSDLKHLCVAAALASVQEMHDTISGTKNKSENVGDSSVVSESPDLPPRILCPRHFAAAFGQVSSSCSDDMSSVRLLRKWAGTFASGLNSGAVQGTCISTDLVAICPIHPWDRS